MTQPPFSQSKHFKCDVQPVDFKEKFTQKCVLRDLQGLAQKKYTSESKPTSQGMQEGKID